MQLVPSLNTFFKLFSSFDPCDSPVWSQAHWQYCTQCWCWGWACKGNKNKKKLTSSPLPASTIIEHKADFSSCHSGLRDVKWGLWLEQHSCLTECALCCADRNILRYVWGTLAALSLRVARLLRQEVVSAAGSFGRLVHPGPGTIPGGLKQLTRRRHYLGLICSLRRQKNGCENWGITRKPKKDVEFLFPWTGLFLLRLKI